VADPRIAAVAFTGSRAGGTALMHSAELPRAESERAGEGPADVATAGLERRRQQDDRVEGTFSLLLASNRDVGQRLVADPRIAAVAFTGSRAGGRVSEPAKARPMSLPRASSAAGSRTTGLMLLISA
jgi:alpha-ketoglutaric semialdehyde dehydrogenase